MPVIYKEVAIYEHDANDKMKNGKTIVKYDYKPKYKLGSFYQRANGLTNNLSNYRGLYYIENYNLNAKPFIHSKDIIRNNGDTLMSEIFHYEKSDSISFKGLKVKRNVSSNCLISYDDSQPPYIYDLISAKYEYAYYTINASVDLLKSKKTVSYNGPIKIIQDELYTYDQNKVLKSLKKKVNDGDVYSEKFIYPMDLYTTNQTYTSMWLNNMLSTVISKESFYNNLAVGVTKTSYRKTTDNQIVPDFIEISSTDLNSSDKYKALTYDKYNKMGKLLQYTAIDGRSIVIIWFYNSQYPIAQIVNATYEQVCSALGGETEMERIGCSLVLSDSDKEKLSNLRSDSTLSKAMITSYTYKPLVGMITSTAPNGLTTYYSYDTFNRLKEVYLLDNGIKKILETYDYHYQTR